MMPAAYELASSRGLRTPVALFVIGLLAACSTPYSYRTDREQLYPAEWPDVVSAGADCKAIEGTFENKGTVIESTKLFKPLMQSFWETKHAQGWLSEMFKIGRDEIVSVDEARQQQASLDAMRACERVSLRIEPAAVNVPGVSIWGAQTIPGIMLIMDGSRRGSADPDGKFEPCATFRVMRNVCRDGALLDPILGSWSARLGVDGSVVVRRVEFLHMQFYEEEIFRAVGRFNRIQ